LGISGSTHFTGRVVRSLCCGNRGFVLASHAEPFGLSVAVAREAGCAIVAPAGIPEVLANGDAGQVVEPGRPDQFAKVLRGLMQDEEALRQWRTRAKTRAGYFTVDRVVGDYDKVNAALKRA
jgi:glycosyltransferase involved in cell wall biosynthesis